MWVANDPVASASVVFSDGIRLACNEVMPHSSAAGIYEPPQAESAALSPLQRRLNRRAYWALLLTLAPVFAAILCIILNSVVESILFYTVTMAVSVVLSVTGLILGVQTGWRMVRIGGWTFGGLAAAVGAFLLGIFSTGAGALVTLLSVSGFTRGRQLRQRGRPQFAPLKPQTAWIRDLPTPGAAPAAPAEVAAAWRQNGLTEHASVASFAKLAIELVALGAPPRLIEAAHKDALDEMRHTELCFSLARDLDGQAIGPAEFPAVFDIGHRRGPQAVQLATLAVESLVDGALNEGVSARVVAELAKTTTEPRIQPVLRTIARDEARHAAHGFDIVRWCIEQGGVPVIAALKGAIQSLPEHAADLDPRLEAPQAWGLPSQTQLARVYAETRRRVIQRTQRLIDAYEMSS